MITKVSNSIFNFLHVPIDYKQHYLERKCLICYLHLPAARISCSEFNKLKLRGFLFWKKFCPIAGEHEHCICEECNSHSIFFNNKVLGIVL
jgi:hypothetical protein